MNQNQALVQSGNGISGKSPVDSDSKTTLAKWLTIFGEHYSKEISAANAAIYQRALAELTVEELEMACLECLKECRFMPTVADILAKCRRAESDNTNESADQEWDLLTSNLHLIDWQQKCLRGTGEPPIQFSLAAQAAIRACGGFEGIYYTKPEYMSHLRRIFMDNYSVAVGREARQLTQGETKELLEQVRNASLTYSESEPG